MARPLSALLAPVLALSLALPAHAKNPKKMTDDELVATLASGSSKDKEKAADEVGERRIPSAIDALRDVCTPQENTPACEHAIWALEKYKSPESHAALGEIVRDRTLETWFRQIALRTLRRENQTLLGSIALDVLAEFRNLDAPFAKNLVEALVDGANVGARDLTILIAKDIGTKRPVRLAALRAAETFKHPRLYEAYVALLSDDDKKVKIQAIDGLATGGYPPSAVVPGLLEVAENDDKGDVRAKAWNALRKYASPTLVPALNRRVTTEPNLFALIPVFQLFAALADETSLAPLQQMLRRVDLGDEGLIDLIHAAIRIGDASSVPSLEFLRDNTESQPVRDEAQRAIDLLRGPDTARFDLIASWPMLDIIRVDLNAPAPEPPGLSVTLGADGRVVYGASVGVSVDGTGVRSEIRVDDSGTGAEATVTIGE